MGKEQLGKQPDSMSVEAKVAAREALISTAYALLDEADSYYGIDVAEVEAKTKIAPIADQLQNLGAELHVTEGNKENPNLRSCYWELHFPKANRKQVWELLKSQNIMLSGPNTVDADTEVYNLYR